MIDLTTVTTVLHLTAPNDRNGNPNRVYVALSGNHVIAVYNEGYQGYHAVPDELCHLAKSAPSIKTSAGEVRRFRAIGNSLDISNL